MNNSQSHEMAFLFDEGNFEVSQSYILKPSQDHFGKTQLSSFQLQSNP